MHAVTQQVLRVAATDTTVLIVGPSGSGKELIAAAMHYGSLRSAGPFVKVNCAAIPETLIESELFGHERGAFTDAKTERKGRFELADGGTLFLDEIGDMPLAVQTRLLRALETRQIERVGGSAPILVRVRVIAATHHHLPTLVRQGKFREDLWYRLDVVRIDLPPLKDRIEDVPLLFRLFAESFASNMQVAPVRLADDAVQWLSRYDWPGNVRQLRNLAERLTVFHAGQTVPAEVVKTHLQRPEQTAPPAAETGRTGVAPPDLTSEPLRHLADARADFERSYIRRALAETGGNITRAAEILGLARENLSRKIRQLGLDQKDDNPSVHPYP
jgi:two-component system nitrogen regulation response regulator GlnG